MKYLLNLNLCIAAAILPIVIDVASAIPSHFSRPWNKQNKCFQKARLSLVEDLRGGSKTKTMQMDMDDNTVIRDDAPFSSMLRMSNLVYHYADLRKIVLAHGANFNEDLTPREKKKKGIVEFDSPDLIVTKKAARRIFPSTLLKHEITADAVLEFVQKNRRYLTDDKDGWLKFNKKGNNEEVLEIEKRVKILGQKFDADIIEFDDDRANEGSKSELLYGIVVNRTDKRITVAFRGSNNLKDWIQNIQVCDKIPAEIKEFAGDDVDVHAGFSDYLFKNASQRDQNTKYDQIVDVLEDVYKYNAPGRDYSDYELYVTGHSLGGAMTQLLAFTLSGSTKAQAFLPSGKPVTAISFASPHCGTVGYQKKFNEFEKDGKLRHIRVSNNGDAVPLIVHTIAPRAGYKQPGVNVHLHPDKKADIAYNKVQKNFINPLRPFTALDMHMLPSHRSRLMREEDGGLVNKDILTKSIEEIYSEYANI